MNHIWLMQPAATEELAPVAGGSGQPSPSNATPEGILGSPLLMMGVMFVLFYFMLIRPQTKKQKETDAMLKALQKGDKVRTTGGIRGEITELTEQDVTLQVDSKVRINVLRSHIAGKIDKPAAEGPKAQGS